MEGDKDPTEIVITGSEERLGGALLELQEAGVNEVRLGIVARDDADWDRTAAFLGAGARGEIEGLTYWANR